MILVRFQRHMGWRFVLLVDGDDDTHGKSCTRHTYLSIRLVRGTIAAGDWYTIT